MSLFKYKVDKETTLPTSEPVENLAAEEDFIS